MTVKYVDFRLLKILFLIIAFSPVLISAQSSRYFRIGNGSDANPKAEFGIALMGGGKDLDAAFQWLCERGKGGDFLVLRAAGDDDYNAYVQGLCHANSVATLIIPSPQAAAEAKVVETIRNAESIFIAGGDQARYISFWKGTAVQNALNDHIAAGKPIGGTSAGLAVLGEFIYSAQGDKPDDEDLTSQQSLANPFFARITLQKDFLRIPLLRDTLTDTHFVTRDRLGRSLVFLARIMQDGWSRHPREIAVDERSAVLVASDGRAEVVGAGKGAYFIRPTRSPEVCSPGRPLSFRGLNVYNAPAGTHFDLKSWKGSGGVEYQLSVVNGMIESTRSNGSAY
jgi:cyanophycinase